MTFSIQGQRILVTGASSGLGAHFAEFLASQGAHVTLAARRGDKIKEVADGIRAAGGEATEALLDVTDPESIAALFGAHAPFDVVINNAGVTDSAPLLTMPHENFDRVIDTNLKGVFGVAQAAAVRMSGNGGGAIVNIASILGLRVAGHVSAYAASKAATIQLTKSMALEWARHGIRVNALCPGYVETSLNDAFFASEAGRALIRRIPQRRLGQLGDLEGPLLLLCSAGSAYMTGSVIAVDGGHLVSSL